MVTNCNALLLVLAIATLIIILAFNNSSPHSSNPVAAFRNALPKERYPDLIAEFGEPDEMSATHVYWYNKKAMYKRIVLKDEQVLHCQPAKHHDFLYSTVHVYLSPAMACTVMQISKSIYYDQLLRELTVRCHFTGANIATLNLALKVATGQLSIKEIQDQDLYKTTIMATVDNKNYRDSLEQENLLMLQTLNSNAPGEELC